MSDQTCETSKNSIVTNDSTWLKKKRKKMSFQKVKNKKSITNYKLCTNIVKLAQEKKKFS